MQQLKFLFVISLAFGCAANNGGDDPPSTLVEGDGDGEEPGDGEGGGPGPEEKPVDDQPAVDDPWIERLDHASAKVIDDGYQFTGYDAGGHEIGWVVVQGLGESLIAAEHRYFRDCEFNELDCFDGLIVFVDYAAETVTIGKTIDPEISERRANALAVRAFGDGDLVPLKQHIKCMFTVSAGLARCGVLGEFDPLGCASSIVAALCACRDTVKEFFPDVNLDKLKELCD